jgi:hypothetical protein
MRMLQATKYDLKCRQGYGVFEFDVSGAVRQVALILVSQQSDWVEVSFVHNEQTVGQTLLTHRQTERVVLIGQTIPTTSPTVTPQADLTGHWRLVYFVSGENANTEHLTMTMSQTSELVRRDPDSDRDVLVDPAQRLDKQGWVKGDFHTHTIYSDGKMTRSQNIESAKKQHLDFFVATDHNVVTGSWPKGSAISTFAGSEVTTPFGHANVLGLTDRPYTAASYVQLNMADGAVAFLAQLGEHNLLSINHPFLGPWSWSLPLPLRVLGAIEILNDPTYADNVRATDKALAFWSQLWSHGWRIAGIGGSDSHMLPTETYEGSTRPSLLGDPGTFVYVPALTRENVVAQVKKGATMVSRIGRPVFTSPDQADLLPGQQLAATVHHFALALPTDLTTDYTTQWLLDGQIVKSEKGPASTYELDVASGYHWLRADVRDEADVLVATLTPVYWGTKTPDVTTFTEVAAGA